ncbi:mitochondrial outer membrane protein (Sam35) [Purpureocillium lilacinum]|uniref:Mitochondrial outer membrane protein (Sam35) n=1 Tax=Purpureocillium lilacinum TaxID=33203 RepID=A0A2U3ELK7_PURLI|nr:mitochondrial outer membrane protein (Sam35) [Purpureocillium lilacinum]
MGSETRSCAESVMSARRATLTLASLHRPHDAMGIFAGWAWPLCSCATAAGDPRTENRRPGIVPGCLASLEDTAQASHRGVFSAAVTSLVSQRRHAAPIYGAACAVACGACTSARAARHLQPSLKALSSFIHYKERITRRSRLSSEQYGTTRKARLPTGGSTANFRWTTGNSPGFGVAESREAHLDPDFLPRFVDGFLCTQTRLGRPVRDLPPFARWGCVVKICRWSRIYEDMTLISVLLEPVFRASQVLRPSWPASGCMLLPWLQRNRDTARSLPSHGDMMPSAFVGTVAQPPSCPQAAQQCLESRRHPRHVTCQTFYREAFKVHLVEHCTARELLPARPARDSAGGPSSAWPPPDGRRGALDPHLQKSCPTSDGLRAHQPPARLVGPSSPHRDSIPPAASSGRRPHIAELPRRKMAAAAPAASTTPASATVPPPHDDAAPAPAAAAAAPPTSAPEQRAGGLFAVPGPVRQLFKLFPLCVYPAESLPARAPAQVRKRPRLQVHARHSSLENDLEANRKAHHVQAFLRIAGVDVEIVPSNNHASPSGALPFLLPASSDPRPDVPLTGSKIERYALDRSQYAMPDVSSSQFDAWLSILSQKIRPAWLFSIYVEPRNHHLLARWYLPSNPILRASTTHTLRAAAVSEILKTTRRPHIDPKQLFANARAAFKALSRLLGDDDWFFGSETPGLFDAEVFAYTQPIIDLAWLWKDQRLTECMNCILEENIFRHRFRLYEWCWGEVPESCATV